MECGFDGKHPRGKRIAKKLLQLSTGKITVSWTRVAEFHIGFYSSVLQMYKTPVAPERSCLSCLPERTCQFSHAQFHFLHLPGWKILIHPQVHLQFPSLFNPNVYSFTIALFKTDKYLSINLRGQVDGNVLESKDYAFYTSNMSEQVLL